MKVFLGGRQLSDNDVLKCTEVTKMEKKLNAVKIAEDILKIEPDCNKAIRLLAQAVIDAERTIKYCDDILRDHHIRVAQLTSDEWLKKYTGEE